MADTKKEYPHRPPMPDGTANTININVRVSKNLLTELDNYCNTNGKARGTVIRESIESTLKRKESNY